MVVAPSHPSFTAELPARRIMILLPLDPRRLPPRIMVLKMYEVRYSATLPVRRTIRAANDDQLADVMFSDSPNRD